MATIPTICMIPSGYKAGKVYSVLPTNGDADLTFTRASEATRVDETGLIETMATGVPRLDYSDGGCPSLLVEPQSTNLFNYSEQFDDISWTNQRVTSVLENIVNPRGEIGTYYLKEDTTPTNSHEIFQGTKTITAGAIITKSIYVKRKEGVADRYLRLQFCDDTFANGARCVFDLQNNIMTTTLNYGLGTLASSKVEDFGNGWFRISLSSKIDDTSTICRSNFYLQNQGGIGASYTGDGVSGCYIFGAQLEALPYATSYIPTVASTVTRVFETYSKAGLQNYINSTQGTFFIKCKSLTNKTGVDTCNVSLNDGTTNNRVVIAYTSNSEIYILLTVSGSPVYDAFLNTDLTQIHSIAISWSENNFLTYINGNLIEQQLTGVTFPINTLNRISSSSGGVPFRSIPYIYNLQVFNQALTDQELQTLTTL